MPISSWMVKLWYIHTKEYCSAIKKKRERERTLGTLNNIDKKWQKLTKSRLAVACMGGTRWGGGRGIGHGGHQETGGSGHCGCGCVSNEMTMCQVRKGEKACFKPPLLWSGLCPSLNTCFCCLSFLLDHVRSTLNLGEWRNISKIKVITTDPNLNWQALVTLVLSIFIRA